MRMGMSRRAHKRKQSPGAREAIRRGCTCDPVENCNGEGRRGQSGLRLFATDDECPLHGVSAVFGFNAVGSQLRQPAEDLPAVLHRRRAEIRSPRLSPSSRAPSRRV
jgi:hypothetical protein